MCGINAIVDLEGRIPDKKELVSNMNARMTYRGPDGEGIYADAQVALGMRRLSIIDVDGGAQPIFNEDRSLAIVCNGEIYNYIELMQDLEARGHIFSSHSDVETILHLYEEKGEGCLEYLRGMFAFVIWDMGKKRVFAARDRVGIKPLYMSRNAGGMWLSSELRTIVGVAGISPTLRPASVHEFLAYSYPLDQRHTPVEEVERLLPGEYLLIDSAGMTLKRYWEPHFGGDEGIAEISDGELLEILQTAMQIHLRSDVPVGILLSGGLDSSTVAAMASRAGTNYTAISAGYSGHHAVDERREARATARKFGLNFIEIENKLSLFDSYFEELVRYCDEPVGDIAAMAQWGLYRQARHLGFKVLLSGVGGDEVMFGYPQWNDWGEALRSMGGDADSRARFITEKLTHNLGGDTGQVATGPLAAAAGEAHHAVRKLFEKAPQGPDQIAALVFGTYLVQNGCQLADKLGMGCSMEVRVPLLDHAFIESVFQLPLVRRFERGRSKPLLRRLMRGTLPDVLLEAPKRGFAPPTDFIVDITNKKADVLLDGKLARSGWVDTAILERMVQKGRNLPWLKVPRVRRAFGIEQAPWFLFRLIAFERWFENVTSPSTIVGPLA